MTNDEIRLILTSDGSNQYAGQIINVLIKTVDDVRMGRIHADKLPELPQRNKKARSSAVWIAGFGIMSVFAPVGLAGQTRKRMEQSTQTNVATMPRDDVE